MSTGHSPLNIKYAEENSHSAITYTYLFLQNSAVAIDAGKLPISTNLFNLFHRSIKNSWAV